MKKFYVLYLAPAEAMEQMANATPEEMKKGMEPWFVWKEKIGSAMVDMGTPLVNPHKVTKSGVSKSDSQVCGFSVIQAEDMDGATEIVKDHPHLSWVEGASIEVLETMPMPGM